MIYFLLDEQTRLVKIGKTVDIESRAQALAREFKTVLTPLGWLPGRYTEETALHRRFADIRHHREWYIPTPELLEFVLVETRHDQSRPSRPWRLWQESERRTLDLLSEIARLE